MDGTAEEHLRIRALEDEGDVGAPLDFLLDVRVNPRDLTPVAYPRLLGLTPIYIHIYIYIYIYIYFFFYITRTLGVTLLDACSFFGILAASSRVKSLC